MIPPAVPRFGSLALLLVLAHGCERPRAPSAPPAAKAAPGATVEAPPQPAPAAPPVQPAPVPASAAAPGALEQPQIVAEALRWLDRWAAVQTAGDVAGYFALYDAEHFAGSKRTANGALKSYDFAGWKADREPMVARSAEVRVSLGQVRTWLDGERDGKPGLSPPLCEVTFQQGFALGEYRDHGTKRLRLLRQGPDAFRIIQEDMLDSAKGLDFTGMPSRPFTLAPAGAVRALELHESDRRESEEHGRESRTVLALRSAGGVTSLHLASQQALNEPSWDSPGEIAIDSSPFAGLRTEFRLQRKGEQLLIAKRHRDEEAGPDPTWTPYANIALGGTTPIPLLCAQAGGPLAPCSSEHPTL